MLKACDTIGCVESASISALDAMVNAIGYFKASNTGSGDQFGYSVALSGDGLTLAVGALVEASAATGIDNTNAGPADNSVSAAGAVYVYARNSSSGRWLQQAYVKASNTGASDQFGWSVALSGDGNTLAVSALYEDSAKTGVIPDAPVETSTPDSALGTNSGAVYVYARSGTTWAQQAYVKASNPGAYDCFGRSVALSGDGNTLAVGAFFEDSARTGVIPGAPVEAVILNDALGTNSGAVYIYARSDSAWAQQAYLKASNTGTSDAFGISIALSSDGLTLAVGASGEGSANTGVIPDAPTEVATPNSALGTDSGAVYVFTRSATLWSQQAYVKASNTGASDYFGTSLALSTDGHTLAVGARGEASAATGVNNAAPGQGDNAAFYAGAAYVFTRSTATWSQQAYVKAPNTGVVTCSATRSH